MATKIVPPNADRDEEKDDQNNAELDMFESVGSWTERSSLLNNYDYFKHNKNYNNNDTKIDLSSNDPLLTSRSVNDVKEWGIRPAIRESWLKPQESMNIETLVREKVNLHKQSLQIPIETNSNKSNKHNNNEEKNRFGFKTNLWGLGPALYGIPGVLIALSLNLFFATSFGLAM